MEARPSSSRSSSSSSSTIGVRAPVAAPKNIARLGKPTPVSTSNLGEPININISTDQFKIPSLPNRPPSSASNQRRPLTMARPSNLEPLSPDPSSSTTITPSRLKRLSLLARSPTFESDQEYQPKPPADENGFRPLESPAGRMRTSTDGSTSGTPRRTGIGIRSSISYSPAPPTCRTTNLDGSTSRPYLGSEPRRSLDSSEGRDLLGLDEETEGQEEVKGETLTERHAELLTAIAQKERRVNELKQELQTEQAALLNLKSRWSTLISSIYPSSSHTTPMQASTSRDRTISTADILTSPSTSSQSEASPETQPGFQALLQDVLGGAPLVDPDVMEGGRRFLGNLMKTVGAAAGGTTPETGKDDKAAQAGTGAGIDLPSLRGMFSWTSTQPFTTVRIRPSDSGSSIKERRSPTTIAAVNSKQSSGVGPIETKPGLYRDLLDD